ncbi:MAG: hypothetical protein IJV60_08720 [Prevotella sp.]|nr:hypothetical protein [Prevotella sp.]
MSPAEARQFHQSVLSIVAHNAVLQRLLHLVDDGVRVSMGHHQRLGARVAVWQPCQGFQIIIPVRWPQYKGFIIPLT